MITLRADNRTLTKSNKYSFLSSNINAGAILIPLKSNTGFAIGDYVLFGDFGSENSEIKQILLVDAGLLNITLSSALKNSHSESTRVYKVPYNQVRFYHTSTAVFSAGTSLGTVGIDPQSWFTTKEDATNGTGFGWFIFLNSTTGANSAPSNAIPYTDFPVNSVKKIIESFLSTLNNKELTLISNEDCFRWLSEGYAILMSKLNIANPKYNTDEEWAFTTSPGIQETALPDNFGDLQSITDAEGRELTVCPVGQIRYYNSMADYGTPMYYIRGGAIGIVPTPAETTTYYIYHAAKTGYLSSYYSNVELPNNNFYCLIDYMMFRAAPKLNRANATTYLQLFDKGAQELILTSKKLDGSIDSFGISNSANV